MNDVPFRPGEKVVFCGIEAVVIANYGKSGTVEIPGEGRCSWYWTFQGEPVRRVRSTELDCAVFGYR